MSGLPTHRFSRPLTPERKETFLATLRETGSPFAAARAATPWSSERHCGLSTFRDERRRDPQFAADWERAIEEAIGRIEAEVVRRAMTPTKRPVFSKGELVGHVEEYDNRLLVTLAKRLNPDDWSERQKVEHSGSVSHEHRHAVAVLKPRDVLLLPEADREPFLAYIGKIAEAKKTLPSGTE
jgi:hypothetical protein